MDTWVSFFSPIINASSSRKRKCLSYFSSQRNVPTQFFLSRLFNSSAYLINVLQTTQLRNFCLRSDPLSFWAELQKFREFSKFSVKTQTLLQLKHIQSFPQLRQKSKQLGTCNLLEHNCSIETDTLDTVLRSRGTMYCCIWRQEMENYS